MIILKIVVTTQILTALIMSVLVHKTIKSATSTEKVKEVQGIVRKVEKFNSILTMVFGLSILLSDNRINYLTLFITTRALQYLTQGYLEQLNSTYQTVFVMEKIDLM